MISKICQKWFQNAPKIDDFWSHFPSKNHAKIDAKNDAEKVMENDEKMMRKWTEF